MDDAARLTIVEFWRTYVILWLIAVALVVMFQMASGRIRFTGLLSSGTMELSPTRVQLLLLTGYGLAWFIAQTLADHRLPDKIPETVLVLFGASHLTYLGGKKLKH